MFQIRTKIFRALIRRLLGGNKIRSVAEGATYGQAVLKFDNLIMRVDMPLDQLRAFDKRKPRRDHAVSRLLKRMLPLADHRISAQHGDGYIHQFGLGDFTIQLESQSKLEELCA